MLAPRTPPRTPYLHVGVGMGSPLPPLGVGMVGALPPPLGAWMHLIF